MGFAGHVLSPGLLGFLGKARVCHALRKKMLGKDQRLKTGEASVLRTQALSGHKATASASQQLRDSASTPHSIFIYLIF